MSDLSASARAALGAAAARAQTHIVGGKSGVDYTQPTGDPGFYGPDSVAWRVHANPVSLAVGGIAAVILELAEPRVRSGFGITPPSAPIRWRACSAPAKRR